eukprot:scpid55567/ scgid26747/ U3 small nucleolar RNA-associated protein 18 homolog
MLRRKVNKRSHPDGGATAPVSKPRLSEDADPAERESFLGTLVFGDGGDVLSSIQERDAKPHKLYRVDGIAGDGEDSDDGSAKKRRRASKSLPDCEAAWEDEDDAALKVDVTAKARTKKLRNEVEEDVMDGQTYTERLRRQFTKVSGAPSWADLPAVRSFGEGSEGGEEVDLLQRTQPMLAGKVSMLPKDVIEICREKDINFSKRPDAGIQSIHFHPSAPVVLTAGLHKQLKLYQVNNEDNPVLHSMFMKNFPIHSAQFTPDGSQIIMSSRRSYFYTYDIASNKAMQNAGMWGRQEKSFEVFAISPDNEFLAFTGRDGSVLIVSNKSKQLVGTCRMSGSAIAMAFTPSGEQLLSAGSDGRVYVWDMKSRTCCHSFMDEGSFHLTSLAVSPDKKFVACGSSSGVVNVYDGSCFLNSEPKPLQTLNNLAPFCASSLQYNHTGEILAMTSRRMEQGLRLTHFPSMSVFSNWPKLKSKLASVQCLSFSPSSEYMAMGNDRGKAMLFRLDHYKSEN